MGKQKTKIGICQWALPIDGPYGCKIASSQGLDGIELDLGPFEKGFPLSRGFVQNEYLKVAKKLNISFPSISPLALGNLNMIGSEDSEEKKVALSAIIKSIDTAEAMNIPIVCIPSFFDGQAKREDRFKKIPESIRYSCIDTKEDFKKTVDVLKYSCDYALSKKIIIGTESSLSIDNTLKLFSEVDRENLKLYFDTQNYYACKKYNVAKMLQELLPLICEIHVKDGINGYFSSALLGEGESNFYKSMDVLIEHNYPGWIILENNYDLGPISLQNDDPLQLMKKDIDVLKKIFAG